MLSGIQSTTTSIILNLKTSLLHEALQLKKHLLALLLVILEVLTRIQNQHVLARVHCKPRLVFLVDHPQVLGRYFALLRPLPLL